MSIPRQSVIESWQQHEQTSFDLAEGSDTTIIDEASRALATETKLYSSANREYQKARCDGWRR